MMPAGKESAHAVKGRAVKSWKMASEPGMLNDEAARALPLQSLGIMETSYLKRHRRRRRREIGW